MCVFSTVGINESDQSPKALTHSQVHLPLCSRTGIFNHNVVKWMDGRIVEGFVVREDTVSKDTCAFVR